MGKGSRNLHTLAQYLLDLALSREDFQDWERVDAAYLDLVEFLLLYALVCVEIVAIGKSLRSTRILQCFTSSSILTHDRVKIIADGYEKDVATGDIAALVIQESSEKGEGTITGLTLFQLAIQCLFVCEIEFHDHTLIIKKPERIQNNEVFQKFIHACLVRIPNFEATAEKEIEKIFFALRSNEDFTRLEGLDKIRNDVKILIYDLKQIRSNLQILRHYGRADGRYFPPDIRCKRSLLHKMRSVKLNTLPGFALTNSSPFSRYKCSWDLQDNSVSNLIIPSEGVNSLIENLKKGKFFGFKVSSIYSGKSMLLWDGVLFVVNGLLLALCEVLKDSSSVSEGVVGFCSVLTYLLGAFTVSLFGKIVLYDLGYWMPWHRRFVRYIQKTFSDDKESRRS